MIFYFIEDFIGFALWIKFLDGSIFIQELENLFDRVVNDTLTS